MVERKTNVELIFKCDLCGKEIEAGYDIMIVPTGLENSKKSGYMMGNMYQKEICEECFEKFKKKFKEMIS